MTARGFTLTLLWPLHTHLLPQAFVFLPLPIGSLAGDRAAAQTLAVELASTSGAFDHEAMATGSHRRWHKSRIGTGDLAPRSSENVRLWLYGEAFVVSVHAALATKPRSIGVTDDRRWREVSTTGETGWDQRYGSLA
jgi:hypothetical protein